MTSRKDGITPEEVWRIVPTIGRESESASPSPLTLATSRRGRFRAHRGQIRRI